MSAILHKVVVGSRLYGLSTAQSDTDCKGFFINDFKELFPRPEQYFGLAPNSPKETLEFDNGIKEGPESVNGVLHSVKKFVQLSAVGNPTLIEVSFVPEQFILETTPFARDVTAFVRENFITKKILTAYNGYFIREVRQSASKKNLKSAAHAYRIGTQALQICKEGTLNPCLEGANHVIVNDIRSGKYTWESLELILAEMDFKLQEANKSNSLPKEPDMDKVNEFLVNLHTSYYRSLGYEF